MRTSLGAGILVAILGMPASAADGKKDPPADDSAAIAERMMIRLEVSEELAEVSFREALDYLAKKADLTFLIDRKNLPEAANARVTLSAMKRVRVETALRTILDQVDADFVIAPDHVKVTSPAAKDAITGHHQRLANLNPRADDGEQSDRAELVRTTPFITASYTDRTATDVFKDLSARAGRTIVVSAGASALAGKNVSVSLSNVAFDSAVLSVAEAVGLRAFRQDNVVVVVTEERAKAREKQAQGAIQVLAGTGIGGAGQFLTLEDLESITRIVGTAKSPDLTKLQAEKKELQDRVNKLTEQIERAGKK